LKNHAVSHSVGTDAKVAGAAWSWPPSSFNAKVRNGWSYTSISLYAFMVCVGTPLPLPSTLYTMLHLCNFRHHVSSLSFCAFYIEVDNKEDISGDTLCHCICYCKMQWCGKSWWCFEIVLLIWDRTQM